MRILLVEDDRMIGSAVQRGLSIDGYSIDWAETASDAELALSTTNYDAVLLDLGLPDKSGLEVLSGLRRKGNQATVIILTARDAVSDRIAGLDGGADDYLVKPFDLDELSARMRAIQRRRLGRAEPLLVQGELELNPASRSCNWKGQSITLSAREFSVLQTLAEQPAVVFSRTQLEDSLYSWGGEIESNAIEVYIHNLRKKLSADLIRTIRGVGYTLGSV